MRAIKNHALSYADVEVKVREATSNDPWSCPPSLLRELARATHDYQDYPKLFSMLWKRLADVEHVLHVTKALVLLQYLLLHGSERFVLDVKRRARDITALTKYKHYDSNNADDAKEARMKAKAIHELLTDEALIKKMRTEAETKRQAALDRGEAEDEEEEEEAAAAEGDEHEPDQIRQQRIRRKQRHEQQRATAAAAAQSGEADEDELEEKRPSNSRVKARPAAAQPVAQKQTKQPSRSSPRPASARADPNNLTDDASFQAVSEEDLDEDEAAQQQQQPAHGGKKSTLKKVIRKRRTVTHEQHDDGEQLDEADAANSNMPKSSHSREQVIEEEQTKQHRSR